VSHGVPVYSPAFASTKPNYTAGWQRRMCDDLPKVTLGDDDDDDDIEDSLIE